MAKMNAADLEIEKLAKKPSMRRAAYDAAVKEAADGDFDGEHPDAQMERYGKVAKRFGVNLGTMVGAVSDELNRRAGSPPPNTKKLVATVGVTDNGYGGNIALFIKAVNPDWRKQPKAEREATETAVYASTLRAAAEVYEQMAAIGNDCAIGIEESRGQIHLEFTANTPPAKELEARKVLERIAGYFNAMERFPKRCKQCGAKADGA